MFSNRQRRSAWLIGLVAVAAVGWVSLAYDRRYDASLKSVHRTMAVQAALGETLSLLKDAETGQRGIVLTGDREFLAPYTKAVGTLPVQLKRLKSLVAGNVVQEGRVRELERLAKAKMNELIETVELAQRGNSGRALDIVREGRGQRLMVAIRAETTRMLEHERAELAKQQAAASAGRSRLSLALVSVWGFFLFVVAGGIWSATRGMAEAKRANERLQKSEREFRVLADNTTDLVCVMDGSGHVQYASPSCQRLLGYSEAEMLDTPPFALIPAEERSDALERFERVKTLGGEQTFVHRLRTKNEELRWFETCYCRVHDDAGTARIQLSSRDVTDRTRAELALRHQTARLESILSSMGDGVVVLDQERRLLVVNPAAREYIKQAEGEQVSANWSERHQVYLLDGQTLFPAEQGPLTRALRGEACDGVELVIHDVNGAFRAFSVSARPIRDGDQRAGCVAVYRDVSEQRRAEHELQESEERLRVLSEASFEGVVITKAGIVLDTNENFASWVGREPHELLGTEGLSYFAPEDREQVQREAAHSGAYEAQMLRRDGSRFPVEVRGRQLTFRGQAVRIAVIRDITEKRRREAELKEQAELLRAMSLRDELTGLFNRRGFLEHAQQSLRNAVRARRAASVFFADLNGMKFINDTLGHEMGDRALVATAKILRAVFRDSDIVARLGGDEFAIFAPECGAADLHGVRARLQRHLEELNQSGAEEFRLSISVGASAFEPGSAADLNALMESADREMYEAKRATSLARATSDSGVREHPLAAPAASEHTIRELERHSR